MRIWMGQENIMLLNYFGYKNRKKIRNNTLSHQLASQKPHSQRPKKENAAQKTAFPKLQADSGITRRWRPTPSR